jgi:hypothetical protein
VVDHRSGFRRAGDLEPERVALAADRVLKQAR